ncbi:phosphoglycerate kinase [Candidatus Kaiserbacteria bacterium RIFOXYB1_FULL_46_14]|uniref:Phosphoglycerate kinase n=1 Tax=Candidatus Kaiserbacteria bacterium RIFOXYB1_FULL_46_14 TaxID=1798531 RepID=A0A1F6FI44_9BACT|nr:MAG: phosphoglycerate kinase [Candidatus Kaiserbacteria bacterium RIFOXYB1_FULL_46_14]
MPAQTGQVGLPLLRDISELKGKKVLLRAGLNVPVKDGVVTERFRIEQAVPTIKYLQDKGAKVIVIGHIGREPEESLKPVFTVLQEMVGAKWGGELLGEASILAGELLYGEVLLLENLRRDPREEADEDSLSAELAALADLYVNDAFADSHRAHSSIVGLPRHLPSYFGPSFMKEYEALSKALKPTSPSLFVIGGAKFETKMPLVEKFSSRYDQVFIGGALVNDVFKARGLQVGKSLVSDIDLTNNDLLKKTNIILPIDVMTTGPNGQRTVTPEEVTEDEMIMDVGPATIEMLAPRIASARTILWNGPLGNFERGFAGGTEALAESIARSDAHSIVGGGDTIAAIRGLHLDNDFGFLSTAGGAMLTFLETGTLPAIDAVLGR